MFTTAFQPLGESFSAGQMKLPAALFTRMSIEPNRRTVSSHRRSTCSGTRTSVGAARTSAPKVARNSSAAGSRCSGLRLASTSLAPSRAYSRAIALPIPVPPPVMIATRPSSVFAGSIVAPLPFRIIHSNYARLDTERRLT